MSSDLSTVFPFIYDEIDNEEVKRLYNDIFNHPVRSIIIPNPEILQDTKEDESPSAASGFNFSDTPESYVWPYDRILPRLLLELQHLNKKGLPQLPLENNPNLRPPQPFLRQSQTPINSPQGVGLRERIGLPELKINTEFRNHTYN